MRLYDAFLHLFFGNRDPGDFPFRFAAEVTNHCNLSCTMCPRETSGRGYGHMGFDLFASLARQAADRDMLFYPQGMGESLLHPRYVEMLQLIHDVGVRYTIVITNGTHLDEDRCRALLDARIPFVIVSLDGADRQVYEEIRVRADYETVVGNTKRLLRMREQRGSEHPVLVLSLVGFPGVKASMDDFEALWKPLLRESDEIFTCSPVSWAGSVTWLAPGSVPTDEEIAGRPPCRMIYKTLTVYYDGRTTPCPYDHACRLEVGDANETPVEEIWHGAPLERLRRLHEEGRSGEIDLCRTCPDHIP
ncbi:MAG: radical SAM protein [Planctomycetota bacterium]